MTLFEIEQEVWEQEGVRIAFIPPMDPAARHPSYRRCYPTALPNNSLCSELTERVAMVVGHGVQFVLLSGVEQALLLNTGDELPVIH